jgi:hypothetical protein
MLLAAVVLAGRAPGEEFNPYEIPKAQFANRVHRIALRPPRVPHDIADPVATRATLEHLLGATLSGKGYQVVESSVFAGLWRTMSERLGGTYDPVSGEVRKEPYAAVLDHVGRELARLHGVDAVLTSYVSIDWAPFERGGFTYTALDQPLRWQGQNIPSALWNHPQQVLGAYLSVVISDLAGSKLYGIRFPIEWTAVYVARGYEEKPVAERLADTVRLQRAVEKDLDPLVPAQGKGATP